MNLERVSSWISVHNACNVKVVDKTSVAASGIFFTTTLVMFCGRIALRTFGHQFEGRTSEIWPISKIMIMIIMHLFGSRSSNSRRESEDICHPIFIGQEILEFLKGKFKEGDKRFRFRSTSFLGPSHCRKNRQFFRHKRKHFQYWNGQNTTFASAYHINAWLYPKWLHLWRFGKFLLK